MQGATVTAALLPGLREIEARWHAAGQGGYRIEVAGAVEESSKGLRRLRQAFRSCCSLPSRC